ncbi:chemotaxis protein CheW [Paracrocinitomix mangrovi]|uniref:chemotaxis protein CheW n=1 Tax=Paracrocinitomix mangrovi TaxID=2862509 RepID=UPI001C8E3620|nr:chemotaxis protein CheW [Paracrocinitomix mangrovi]UKN01601.1 chemotaxis protein CheW [Paracrocinitomix mangrovi]
MTSEKKELTVEEVRKQAALEKKQEEVGTLVQLIIFKLGEEEYALNIDQIKEVVLTPGIAKIPQTPDYIKGVANIRGNVIAIVDLERKFNLSDTAKLEEKGNYTLVVESDSFKIGILVKEVPNTLTVAEKDIDNSTTVLQYSNLDQDCIRGIVKSGERMIIMVDMIKMMEAEDLNKLTKK